MARRPIFIAGISLFSLISNSNLISFFKLLFSRVFNFKVSVNKEKNPTISLSQITSCVKFKFISCCFKASFFKKFVKSLESHSKFDKSCFSFKISK